MKLFGEYDRTYTGYIDPEEPFYSYLNRSGRPEFAAARDVLEGWFAAYPETAQAKLASTFTSDDYGPHLGAFFELYCYSLLRACHFEVHVEQVVDPEKGNPIDFTVGPVQTPDFCVESTVVADAELTVKSRQHLNSLMERLNRIPSHRRLFLEVVSASKQQLRYADISASVERWLGTLDAGTGAAPTSGSGGDDGFDSEPSHDWAGDGWALRFTLLPGVREGDLVPVLDEGADWVGTMSRLKSTLQQKAKQHDGVQVPYVIAVDVVGIETMFRSDESVMEDLFGKEVIIFDPSADRVVAVKRSPELPRRSDREKGFWFGRSGPRNQHVSAVLLVNAVTPLSVVNLEQTPVLLHNPWALHPISPRVWPGPQYLATDMATGAYERQEGKTIAEIFGRGE